MNIHFCSWYWGCEPLFAECFDNSDAHFSTSRLRGLQVARCVVAFLLGSNPVFGRLTKLSGAILGVGRIVSKPVVPDGEIVPRQMMNLSLIFDHRIVDGAPAARFLNTLGEHLEAPGLWLL